MASTSCLEIGVPNTLIMPAGVPVTGSPASPDRAEIEGTVGEIRSKPENA